MNTGPDIAAGPARRVMGVVMTTGWVVAGVMVLAFWRERKLRQIGEVRRRLRA